MPSPSGSANPGLKLHDAENRQSLKVSVLIGIIVFHALALLACLPWLFSWAGVFWAVGGVYLFGMFGMNIGYHRLLTHRGFACPLWLEHALALVGVCCWQGTPLHWISVHRLHHQHSDQPDDPHSPRKSFFWSHMGWFLMHDPEVYNRSLYLRYARDLLPDRFYTWLEQPRVWFSIHGAQWVAFFAAGALVGAVSTGTPLGACQAGLSWLIWGVLVRTVLIWHITWSVNSLTHVWGYRNFETRDDSRNNWLVALVANGEGWHNNHHADPRSAAHGQRWWEFDVSYLTICALERTGLVWDVVRPRDVQPRSEERRMAA